MKPTKLALKSSGPRIEMMPLSKLVGAPRNPKRHDIGTISASIKRFGYVAPVVLNESTGRIVAGHGRVEALRSMKASGRARPGRMEEHNGDWLVPVVRGVSFASEAEAEAYLVSDNALVSAGGWDDAQLAALLSDLKASDAGLEGIGFDGDDLDEILKRLNPQSHDSRLEDLAPPLPPPQSTWVLVRIPTVKYSEYACLMETLSTDSDILFFSTVSNG